MILEIIKYFLKEDQYKNLLSTDISHYNSTYRNIYEEYLDQNKVYDLEIPSESIRFLDRAIILLENKEHDMIIIPIEDFNQDDSYILLVHKELRKEIKN